MPQMNNCGSAAIAVQATCSITANFAPLAQGQRTASLVITDDGAGSPQSVALRGSGVAPFQLSPSGSTSSTVSAGQTAQYALQAVAGPGFSGNISLTCGGAPLAATCNVSPNSVVLSGSGATPVPGFRLWPLALTWAAVLCVLLILKTKSRRTFPARLAYAAILFSVTLLGAAGCGGGATSSATPQPQPRTVTPQGTTTLTVTAQSGTLPAQTVQLTITVN